MLASAGALMDAAGMLIIRPRRRAAEWVLELEPLITSSKEQQAPLGDVKGNITQLFKKNNLLFSTSLAGQQHSYSGSGTRTSSQQWNFAGYVALQNKLSSGNAGGLSQMTIIFELANI